MAMHAPLEAADAFRTLTSVEAVRSSLFSAAERLGFKYLVCCDLPRPGENPKALQFANSWPAAWANRYFGQSYFVRDPLVRELSRTCRPFRWDEVLENRRISRAERTIVREAADFGLRQGLVVPIHSYDGRTGVLSMAGEHCDVDERSRAELHLTAIYAHARLKDLLGFSEMSRPAVRLTPRQRECLHWVAAGKSAWAIGEILGISENTVHATLENAKRRLGVATRVQAVLRAVMTGQVRI
jgi:LuxR family quorum sensing-dependent transcriptional regulator